MDRIRRALDLAREQRNHSTETHRETPNRFESQSSHRVPTTIVYTKTRLFSPAPEQLEANRIIDTAGHGGAAEAFRVLRTQILQRLQQNDWRSLAVFSPGTHDGKTTTAINLAVSLANDHAHTVLLVDFDFKRPSIAERFGLTPEWGADDVLRGQVDVQECLYHPEGYDRLVILPARVPLPNSSEAIAGPRGRRLVAELRNRYPERILLFDLPPVLKADDALAFAPLVECGLVVAAEGATRRDELVRCMELLRRTPIVGTVLNRAMNATTPHG